MFRDTADNPVANYPDAIPWGVAHTYSVRLDCNAGWVLRTAGAVADMAVEGRKLGDVSWVNLEATGIDLSPYDGTPQTFEIRITAGAGAGETRRIFELESTPA